jgi:hypothetical protein
VEVSPAGHTSVSSSTSLAVAISSVTPGGDKGAANASGDARLCASGSNRAPTVDAAGQTEGTIPATEKGSLGHAAPEVNVPSQALEDLTRMGAEAEHLEEIKRDGAGPDPVPMDIEPAPSEAEGPSIKRSSLAGKVAYSLPPSLQSSAPPSGSLRTLVKEAIRASPRRQLFRSEICDYISTVYPFYKRDDVSFTNYVSKILCKSGFTKIPTGDWKSLWGLQEGVRQSSSEAQSHVHDGSLSQAAHPRISAKNIRELITKAIEAAPQGALNLQEIQTFIAQTYPSGGDPNLQVELRGKISKVLSKSFRRVARSPGRRKSGNLWALKADAVSIFRPTLEATF